VQGIGFSRLSQNHNKLTVDGNNYCTPAQLAIIPSRECVDTLFNGVSPHSLLGMVLSGLRSNLIRDHPSKTSGQKGGGEPPPPFTVVKPPPSPKTSGSQNILRFGQLHEIQSGRPWTGGGGGRVYRGVWTMLLEKGRGVPNEKLLFSRTSLMDDPLQMPMQHNNTSYTVNST